MTTQQILTKVKALLPVGWSAHEGFFLSMSGACSKTHVSVHLTDASLPEHLKYRSTRGKSPEEAAAIKAERDQLIADRKLNAAKVAIVIKSQLPRLNITVDGDTIYVR